MIGGVNDRDPLAIENAEAIEAVLGRVRLAPQHEAELLNCVRWGGTVGGHCATAVRIAAGRCPELAQALWDLGA